MKKYPILLIAFSWATGCTSSHLVDFDQAGLWIPKAQEQLLGENVNVRTTSGEEFSGRLQSLNGDSLRVQDGDKPSVEIALANVSYVGASSNVAGPILGGIGGFFMGGAIGGAIGRSNAEDGRTDEFFSGLGGSLVGATVGGVIGMAVGGAATTADQYEITHWRNR